MAARGSADSPHALESEKGVCIQGESANALFEGEGERNLKPIRRDGEMLKDLVLRNRSCRRFVQTERITMQVLEDLVNLARLSASAANLQPLKYLLSCEPDRNALIFPCLKWAAYLQDWPGPEQGERPTGYILILGDTGITGTFGCDHGIASQTILLGATEIGLAGCIIASIEREKLRTSLNIPPHLEILLVIALGTPNERIVLEELRPSGSVKYWRDQNGVHHVPKRSLQEIIVGSSNSPAGANA